MLENKKMYGIDLGTTNSAISVYLGNETSQIIRLEDGETTMPSCVLSVGCNYIVGREAYNKRYESNACYSIKRKIGTDYIHKFVEVDIDGTELIREATPVEISAEILKALVKKAAYLHPGIKNVTITVPADFSSEQRKLTQEAGELAGLNVVSMINEPTAASLCYQAQETKEIMVFDLGGGTFDVSLIRITAPQVSVDAESQGLNFKGLGVDLGEINVSTSRPIYEIIASEGNHSLGGDDIDEIVLQLAMSDFNSSMRKAGKPYPLDKHVSKEFIGQLKLKIEQVKKQMGSSVGSITYIPINEEGSLLKGEEFPVSYSHLEKATRKVYHQTKLLVNRVLGKKSVNRDHIKEIVLVGGSTKSSILKDLLAQDFPMCDLNSQYNPDESVAIGASIQTAVTMGASETSIIDVSPYTISVAVLSEDALGNWKSGRVLPLIKKNTPLPVMVKKQYAIENNGKELGIRIYQGEDVLEKACTHLGNIVLDREDANSETAELQVIVNSQGVLEFKVSSGGSTRVVELGNILGVKSQDKKVSAYARFANRWRQQLESFGVKMTPKLQKALSDYEATGDAKSAAYIKKLLGTNSKSQDEITLKHTSIFDVKDSLDSEEE